MAKRIDQLQADEIIELLSSPRDRQIPYTRSALVFQLASLYLEASREGETNLRVKIGAEFKRLSEGDPEIKIQVGSLLI